MEGVNVAVSMMKVCCLHQEGQRHYNQGNVQGAIDSFRSALKKAKSINERHIENICTHNLASVYAAKGDKESLEELLQSLPDQFIDDIMQEEGNNIIYLRAVANRSVSLYEQALKVVSDSRTQTYLLEQLVKQLSEEQDSRKKIKYLEQLKEGFRDKLNDMRRFQVMCQLARLYIRDSSTEDAQKVLRELKKEVADYTNLRRGNTSLGTRLLRRDVQEMGCLVPLWNEVGLMFTFLTKYQKALECFQNGQELITNKTQESILRRAVLKQNIGAVRNMNGRSKEDFELAIECHLDAIKAFGEYARSRQESDTTETKQPRSGKLVNTCAGNGERLLYTVPIENKGRWVIHEALKEDQAASAGAARSFLNLGHAHFKLGDTMCAQQRFSQADIYAKEAQDTRTRIHAHESLASIAMQLSYSRAARKYLLTALTLAISSEGWEDDDGQHDSSDVQRITDKLSKIHVTMSADREHFNRTDSHWPIVRPSPGKKLCATTLQASSKQHAHKVEEDSDN